MAEQTITIVIDDNGKIKADTQGIKGEMCLDELQDLLEDVADLSSIKKTDEFYQEIKVSNQDKIRRKL